MDNLRNLASGKELNMSKDTTNNMFNPQACPGDSVTPKACSNGSISRPQADEPPPSAFAKASSDRQGWGLNRGKGLFVTGTDTGVGKTLIAGAIAKILLQKGKNTGVFKPIATGCKRTQQGLVSEDARFLAHCADSEFGLDIINPIKFEKPAAPFSCEKAENRKVDFVKIAVAYNHICSKSDFVIVEGIGGIRVPITDGLDVLTLAKAFNLPVVIVARPNLGTINHTLLTIDAVRSAHLPLAGVIISGYDESKTDFAQQTCPAAIAETGKTQILAVVPFDRQTQIEKGIIGDIVLDSLTGIDWLRIIEGAG
jgi:dethiobiotin synthetase